MTSASCRPDTFCRGGWLELRLAATVTVSGADGEQLDVPAEGGQVDGVASGWGGTVRVGGEKRWWTEAKRTWREEVLAGRGGFGGRVQDNIILVDGDTRRGRSGGAGGTEKLRITVVLGAVRVAGRILPKSWEKGPFFEFLGSIWSFHGLEMVLG